MPQRVHIKPAELKRMAEIAKSEGVTVEIERDGDKVRVTPFYGDASSCDSMMDGQSALAKWKAENGHDSPKKGKGGFDIISDPQHPLAIWYKDLVFDPKTMSETDLQRLIKDADDRWKQSIPQKKVGKREWSALEKLTQIGVGKRVLQWTVSGCGDDTLARLVARGYVGEEELLPSAEIKQGLSKKEIWLLDAGHEAYKASGVSS